MPPVKSSSESVALASHSDSRDSLNIRGSRARWVVCPLGRIRGNDRRVTYPRRIREYRKEESTVSPLHHDGRPGRRRYYVTTSRPAAGRTRVFVNFFLWLCSPCSGSLARAGHVTVKFTAAAASRSWPVPAIGIRLDSVTSRDRDRRPGQSPRPAGSHVVSRAAVPGSGLILSGVAASAAASAARAVPPCCGHRGRVRVGPAGSRRHRHLRAAARWPRLGRHGHGGPATGMPVVAPAAPCLRPPPGRRRIDRAAAVAARARLPRNSD